MDYNIVAILLFISVLVNFALIVLFAAHKTDKPYESYKDYSVHQGYREVEPGIFLPEGKATREHAEALRKLN